MKKRTVTYGSDPTKFGGVIYESDFYTNGPSGNIASRIVKDWSFDNFCKHMAKNNTRQKEYMKNQNIKKTKKETKPTE